LPGLAGMGKPFLQTNKHDNIMKRTYIEPSVKTTHIDPKDVCETVSVNENYVIEDMQGKKYDIDVWDEDEEEE